MISCSSKILSSYSPRKLSLFPSVLVGVSPLLSAHEVPWGSPVALVPRIVAIVSLSSSLDGHLFEDRDCLLSTHAHCVVQCPAQRISIQQMIVEG